MINQWQQDWQKADALFNDINQALEDGKWDKVLEYKNNPEKLPNIKYWRDKLEPVFKEAAENVAKQALPNTENQAEQDNYPQENPNTEEPSADETPSSEELPQGGY
jgi:serine/threonine-protein kinase